jgi:hypothetical protein
MEVTAKVGQQANPVHLMTVAGLQSFLVRGKLLPGFALVFATAFVVRLVFLVAWTTLFEMHFDGKEVGNIASNLIAGRGFSSPFSQGAQPTSLYAPLVPIAWAAVMHMTGGSSDTTVSAIIGIQAVASAFAAAFYWLIARRLASRLPGVPSALAAATAFLFCVWPESLLRLTDTWYFVWQELGVVALVFCAMRWSDNPSIREGLIMGAVAGGVVLVNPTPAPIYAIALIVPLVARRKNLAIAHAAVASGVVAVVIVSPWLVRDAIVFGQFVPIRSGFGLQLLQGNNPVGSVRQNLEMPHPLVQKEELNRYEMMGETNYMQMAWDQATQYICQNPVVTVIRTIQRIYVYWCTDIFETFPSWSPQSKWWDLGIRARLLALTTIASALIPLAIVLLGLFSDRLRGLPYWPIFLSLFLFLPLPYYITTVVDGYSQATRPWLALLAVVVIFRPRSITNKLVSAG